MRGRRWHLAWVLVFAAACGAPPSIDDAGPDAGQPDAGQPDSGQPDAGQPDAGRPDAGQPDAGQPDAGEPDSGQGDAGQPDAGQPDAGSPDAGRPDAGTGCLAPSGIGAPFRVRAMAANLTSGNNQSYDPGHGQRIMQGLDPDVVMIQEFNYGTNSTADIAGFVAATFDGGWSYTRGAGQIPNGVISRWPLLASGEWLDPQVGNRTFAWAKLDLPGPRDLWVVSVHFLTSNAGDRSAEARAVVSQLQANVPANDFVLIGGDFNTDTRTEQCYADLRPRFVSNGAQPVDQANNPGTNRNRDKPYDQVLASPCLQANQVPVAIGAQRFDAGLVFDSRVYTPLADVAPVQQGDSAAANMQHMGVVKDFTIQP